MSDEARGSRMRRLPENAMDKKKRGEGSKTGGNEAEFQEADGDRSPPATPGEQRGPESEVLYSEEYVMNETNRGLAIIITDKLHPVIGELEECFKNLGFDVTLCSNLRCNEMEGSMKRAAGRDHTDNDCFMCVILSQMADGVIHRADGSIGIQKLIEPFKGHNCLSLVGKPKIFFFIQACHGVDEVDTTRTSEPTKYNKQRLPTEADILIAYSVLAGDGLLFIQAINHVFSKYCKVLDLMRLMTTVNGILQKRNNQILCITSMLTKEVYFRPKRISYKSSGDSIDLLRKSNTRKSNTRKSNTRKSNTRKWCLGCCHMC